MIELMKNNNRLDQSLSETYRHSQLVVMPLVNSPLTKLIHLPVGSAHFGKQLYGRSGVNKYL